MPKVIIFEDETLYAQILQQTYTDDGWEVRTFSFPPPDVIDIIANERPDLIHTDLNMPRMNGLALTRLIRLDPRTSSIPILMVTSTVHDQAVADARRQGVTAYLGKGDSTPANIASQARSLLSSDLRNSQ